MLFILLCLVTVYISLKFFKNWSRLIFSFLFYTLRFNFNFKFFLKFIFYFVLFSMHFAFSYKSSMQSDAFVIYRPVFSQKSTICTDWIAINVIMLTWCHDVATSHTWRRVFADTNNLLLLFNIVVQSQTYRFVWFCINFLNIFLFNLGVKELINFDKFLSYCFLRTPWITPDFMLKYLLTILTSLEITLGHHRFSSSGTRLPV